MDDREPFLIRFSRHAMSFMAGLATSHLILTYGGF